MTSRWILQKVAAVLALMAMAVTAFAHNGVEHVMGTITAVTDTSITVSTVKHTSVTVALDPSTTFSNNNAQAGQKDLKVGQRVVINAKPGSDHKLSAVSVRWGANSSAHADHAAQKR